MANEKEKQTLAKIIGALQKKDYKKAYKIAAQRQNDLAVLFPIPDVVSSRKAEKENHERSVSDGKMVAIKKGWTPLDVVRAHLIAFKNITGLELMFKYRIQHLKQHIWILRKDVEFMAKYTIRTEMVESKKWGTKYAVYHLENKAKPESN